MVCESCRPSHWRPYSESPPIEANLGTSALFASVLAGERGERRKGEGACAALGLLGGFFSIAEAFKRIGCLFLLKSAGFMCGDPQRVWWRGDGGLFLVGGGAGRLVRLPALFAGRVRAVGASFRTSSEGGGAGKLWLGRGGARGGVGSGVHGRSAVPFATAWRRRPWSLAFPNGGRGALGVPFRGPAPGPRRLASLPTLVATAEGVFFPREERGVWPRGPPSRAASVGGGARGRKG